MMVVNAVSYGSAFRKASVQTVALARRSIITEIRQLATVLPGFIFPLLLAAIYTHQFQPTLQLPGFPKVDSFLDFLLPAAILQMVSFGSNASGMELALDIENGFMDRLLSSPVARVPVLIGRIAGSAILAISKTLVMIFIFLLCGAGIAGGIRAVIILMLVAALLVVIIGGLSQILAIRTGSQEVVGATFPLVFVLIFMSSAFFPTSLMSGWFKVLAESNPITWIIDPLRRLVIEGWSWSDAFSALLVSAVGAVLVTGLSVRSLYRSLARS